MNLQKIKSLFVVELLNTSRKLAKDGKKEKVTKKNVVWRNLAQHLAVMLIMTLLFFPILLNLPVPFSQLPGMASYMMFMMVSLGLLQMFVMVYGTLFEKQDFSEYLALPFTKGEFLLSKLLVIVLTTASFIFPVAVFVSVFGYEQGHSLWYVIPFALLTFLLITTTLLAAIIVLVSFVSRTKFFQRYEKYIIVIFYLLMMGLIFYISFAMNATPDTLPENAANASAIDHAPSHLMLPFIQVLTKNAASGWLGVGAWLLVAALLLVINYRQVLPTLFMEQKSPQQPAKKAQKKRSHTNKSSGYKSLKSTLFKYQLSLINDTTLILMIIFGKVYFPLIIFLPMVLQRASLSFLSIDFSLAGYLLIGMAASGLTISDMSLVGVSISLEKENFYYLKTLPFNFAQYMHRKFMYGFLFEWTFGLLVYLIFGLLFKVPLIILAVFLIGYSVGTYMWSAHYFRRDWRLLKLNWTNINEVLYRSSHRVLSIMGTFLAMIALAALSGGLIAVLTVVELKWKILIAAACVLGVVGALYLTIRHMNQRFWPIFDNELVDDEFDDRFENTGFDKDQSMNPLRRIFYEPARRLTFGDYLVTFFSTNVALQIIGTIIYVLFNLNRLAREGLTFLLNTSTDLAIYMTLLSLPVMLGVIYWRKIPLFNRKQLLPKESAFLPGLTKKDWKFLGVYIPVSYVLYRVGGILVEKWFGEGGTPVNQQAIEQMAQQTPLWVLFLMIVIVAPVVEELFFRAMIMFGKPKVEPGWFVTIISAVIFGLIHTPTDIPSAYAYIGMGLIFAIAAKKTNSVEASMVYHFLNNLLGFIAIAYMVLS